MSSQRRDITIGLERCVAERPAVLHGARFGLLMNRASVDRHLRFACDVLNEAYPGQLAALFSPQHGLWGEQQANMIETPHGRHPRLGVPIYSLYSETRTPTPEMLDGLDCYVVDLQDVGCRVYTFVWTVMNCLAACAAAGIPVLILDRPNPLGNAVEGPLLEPEYRSFVGGASIPMRHGLTLGELATLLNEESVRPFAERKATLEVLAVAGCPPEVTFDQLDRHWIPPSPNLPRFESALVYPGQVLLEGTNLSEGRGTTTPFEICGAPFIDEFELCDLMGEFDLPGVRLLPVRFTPTFDKWAGQNCGGVTLHVTDAVAFQPYRTSVAILSAVFQKWPDHAAWLPPPYEYETERMPIDILSGSDRLRTLLSNGTPAGAELLDNLCQVDESEWERRTRATG
jgi:uncharacterized protein YbbC (DUF1343 family)